MLQKSPNLLEYTLSIVFILQNQRAAESFDDESLCRLYEVGRLKDEEDDQVSHLLLYGLQLLKIICILVPSK